jgi:hypothetical protein
MENANCVILDHESPEADSRFEVKWTLEP